MKLVPYERGGILGDGIFKDFFDFPFMQQNNLIKADIKETPEEYIVEADMPGVDKENIELNCENGVLTITARKSEEKKEEAQGFIRRERYTGEASRCFSLRDVNEDDISAKLDNGVLYVTLPKKSGDKHQRNIEIE